MTSGPEQLPSNNLILADLKIREVERKLVLVYKLIRLTGDIPSVGLAPKTRNWYETHWLDGRRATEKPAM